MLSILAVRGLPLLHAPHIVFLQTTGLVLSPKPTSARLIYMYTSQRTDTTVGYLVKHE